MARRNLIKRKVLEILQERFGESMAAEVRSLSEERDIFDVIIEKTPVDKVTLMDIISDKLQLCWIDVNKIKIEKINVDVVPLPVMWEKRVIPLGIIGHSLSLIMADVLDILVRDELSAMTGCEIVPVLAFPPDIDTLLAKLKNPSDDIGLDSDDVEAVIDFDESAMSSVNLIEEGEQGPIVRMVNLMIKEGLNQRASDIHIEPMEDCIRLRYRIDGTLQDILTVPKNKQAAVLTRLKIMSGMDITEWRIPQDGRFRMRHKGKLIDFRVSSLPTVFGEKFVLRVLDKSNLQVGLDSLGFLPQPLEEFKNAVKAPYGLILVTGPTGSGKSTTLYSVLQELNKPEVHIITVEDPVEYQVEGLTQIQVNHDIGLTFASALRAILRQSPDIVLVGEIRDSETADIAVKASLTGNLVLSTLHTNDAAGAITRLIDMGVEPFLVASSLVLTSAQRLCRRICEDCKEIVEIPREVFEKEGFTYPEGMVFYKGRGCDKCRNTGYKGRIATIETLTMTDELRLLVLKGATSDELKEYAIKHHGMRTLRDNTFELFLEGKTTFEEVLRVTAED